MSRDAQREQITPELLLRAYSVGLFPMAESADDPDLHWVEPKERGFIPLDGLMVSKSLAKLVKSDRFEVSADRDFDSVIALCAGRGQMNGAEPTWISGEIRRLYRALFDMGHAHTIEVREGGELVGGLYGVSLGGAFFGESMFHVARDASKVALVHLVARLRRGGYRLLDVQFVTDHLATLGAQAVPRRAYRTMLDAALQVAPDERVWNAELALDERSALAIAAP